VGRAHDGPSGIARTLGEATDAARLAVTRSASGYFVHIDRLGLAQLLLAWTRTDTFQPAARSLLVPLDGQPGDLLRTLSAYLDAESSLAETAAVLGVHRNTVAARMNRIQELLHVNLTEPDERLALHLACRTTLTTRITSSDRRRLNADKSIAPFSAWTLCPFHPQANTYPAPLAATPIALTIIEGRRLGPALRGSRRGGAGPSARSGRPIARGAVTRIVFASATVARSSIRSSNAPDGTTSVLAKAEDPRLEICSVAEVASAVPPPVLLERGVDVEFAQRRRLVTWM
jgi:hypothetical protein